MKQALGVYALSYKNRFDTISHVMAYPQKALVNTKYNKMLHYDEMLTGLNPIVAIMCYTGFNQEDSVILNKGSVDRGMFVTTAYRTLSCEEKKKTNCSFEKIEIPPLSCQSKALNYSKLGKDGIAAFVKRKRAAQSKAGDAKKGDEQSKGQKPTFVKTGASEGLEEKINLFLEKNVPTQPAKWAASIAAAKRKFDVYPSAYANGWAAKNYKSKGGGWKTGK